MLKFVCLLWGCYKHKNDHFMTLFVLLLGFFGGERVETGTIVFTMVKSFGYLAGVFKCFWGQTVFTSSFSHFLVRNIKMFEDICFQQFSILIS